MRARSQRAWLIGVAGLLLVGAATLVFSALGDNVAYSRSPTQVVTGTDISPGDRLRVGGLVGVDSIQHADDGEVSFEVTDGEHSVFVRYTGLTPDLFEEGQGIVAEGVYGADGWLEATRLLARHDESYMPKEAYEALKAAGGEAAVGASSYDAQGAGE